MSSFGMINQPQLHNHGEQRNPGEGDAGTSRTDGRKRRRKLACHNCHRLKTRCDFDVGTHVCRRCQTLRLECVMFDQPAAGAPSAITTDKPLAAPTGFVTLEHIRDSIDALRNELKSSCVASGANCLQDSSQHTPAYAAALPSNASHEDEDKLPQDPPDSSTTTAPISIIRQVIVDRDAGYRREFPDTTPDVVAAGIVPETEALQLATKFCEYHHDLLHCPGVDIGTLVRQIRESSPFLFAVCCFSATTYRIPPGRDAPQPFDLLKSHVMAVLGQTLLQSPIPTESIYAMVIISTLTPPIRARQPYVDSWLLSGYAAQQAMLVIDFTTITDNLNANRVSPGNVRHLRLWATICLNHLHFSLGCGRPPVMSPAYIDQAYLILNSSQDNIEDEFIIAEIMLYRRFKRTVDAKIRVGHDGRCENLEGWRQEWRRLLNVSHHELLDLSYHFVYVAVIMRSLELLKESRMPADHTPIDEGPLISVACGHALKVLHYANKAPKQVKMTLTAFRYMNVAYCALMLSRYLPVCGTPAREILGLIYDTQKNLDNPSGRVNSALSVALSQAKNELQTAGDSWEIPSDHPDTDCEITAFDPSTGFHQGYPLSLEDINDCFPSFGTLFGDTSTMPIMPFMELP